jgi:hypothetical protein
VKPEQEMGMRRFWIGSMLLVVAIALGACGTGGTTSTGDRAGRRGVAGSDAKTITIYRSPTCSCCKEYEAYLASAGYRVEVIELADVSVKKRELGVPEAAWSCHTALLGGYVVEGHVPLEILSKLLTEKPAIEGIALPGMPGGAPGMGTPKTGPLHVVSFDETGNLAHFAEF